MLPICCFLGSHTRYGLESSLTSHLFFRMVLSRWKGALSDTKLVMLQPIIVSIPILSGFTRIYPDLLKLRSSQIPFFLLTVCWWHPNPRLTSWFFTSFRMANSWLFSWKLSRAEVGKSQGSPSRWANNGLKSGSCQHLVSGPPEFHHGRKNPCCSGLDVWYFPFNPRHS